jgi:hypothetical protein
VRVSSNRRVILFHELGVASALIAIIMASMGLDVRYLNLSARFRTDRVAAFLAARSVRPLSYEKVHSAVAKCFDLLTERAKGVYAKLIASPEIEAAIGSAFDMTPTDRRRFSLACEHHVISDMRELAELMVFATEIYREHSPKVIWVVAIASPLSREMVKIHRERGLPLRLCPSLSPSLLVILHRGWRKYLKVMKNALSKRLLRTKSVYPSGKDTSSERAAKLDQPVIFFPHKGIFYGTLFAKDHYYASESESPYSPKNMLHLSLGEQTEERADAYYEANAIPHTDLYALGAQNAASWVRDFARLLWKHRKTATVDGWGMFVWRTQFYFSRYCQLRLYLGGLERLPNARIALVGYDIAFPPMLSVALGLRKVITVATQERFYVIFQRIYRLIFDHYLVIGPRVTRFLAEDGSGSMIGSCTPIGPVRAEAILDCLKKPFPEKYRELKKTYFLILALDWHSVANAIDNARAFANHWEANRRFYQDMISMAEAFPGAYVVIKGKDTKATTLPVMRDLMATIDRMPNIAIETDLAQHSPALMASMADLTIACHTSLVDEILAVGRPALIYDFVGFPSGFFDYDGYPIIVTRKTELIERVAGIMQGRPLMRESQFCEMRREFYSYDTTGLTPRARLRTILDDIYNQPFPA